MPPKEDPLGPKHFPVSMQDAEQWLSRMEDVSAAVRDFLSSTPEDDEERRRLRDEKKRAEAIATDKERRRRRYNTQYYSRYDADETIDKLLQEAELDDKAAEAATKQAAEKKRAKELEGFSEFEKLTLEQAQKQKSRGNDAVKAGQWEDALAAYDNALGMNPPDDALVLTLTNNRAMVNVKLSRWEAAVADASYVIQRERFNVKALLRRARGLLELHRPSDSLTDLEVVLRAEPKNVEATEMKNQALRDQDEIAWADRVRTERPADVETLVERTTALREATAKLVKVLSFAEEATTSSSTATRRLSTDQDVDAALEDASLALCSAGTLLHDGGMVTVFRLARGLESIRSLFDAAIAYLGLDGTAAAGVEGASSDAAAASAGGAAHQRVLTTPGGVIFVASLLRVSARALDTTTAVATTVDDAAFADRLLRVAANAAAAPGAGSKKSAKEGGPLLPQTMLAATAGMQLVASLAADRRLSAKVWAELSGRIRLAKWIDDWQRDPRCIEGLKAVEHVLRDESIRAAVVKYHDWDALALSAIGGTSTAKVTAIVTQQQQPKRSSTARDLGASLLARLTAVPEWLEKFNDASTPASTQRRKQMLDVVAEHAAVGLRDALDGGAAASRAFSNEAYLAVLHNASIAAERRAEVAAVCQRSGLHELMVRYQAEAIRSMQPAGAPVFETLNVATRALNLLGKIVLTNQEVETACASSIHALMAWLALSLAGNGSATITERDYAEQCVENASLVVASLLSKGASAKSVAITIVTQMDVADGVARLLAVLRSSPARAAGNAAMALSCLPALCPESVPLAATIVDFHKVFLDRIVGLRGDLHEFERQGRRGSAEWAAARGAKRNVAISLSKYCKDEGIMNRVRDSSGIEILYSALDDSDKNMNAA
jgi:tetratricopeptide (TPR) repeat protein